MNALKKAINFLAPPPGQAEDGRDAWPSRISYILATMGGTIGMGNVLRFPSVVYNNHGLQWFIPYLMAVVIIAIPGLILEVAIGNAYRGGPVVAYNAMNKRLRGTGLSLIFIGFMVLTYFNVIVTWFMMFFARSFQSPLPWVNQDPEQYFLRDILRTVDPVEEGAYTSYSAIGMVGEIAGWCAFVWFLVWLCIFRGTGWTGRVVYFTMGMPLVMIIILVGRGVSLENAGEGVKLYFATWRGGQLAAPGIWQAACGQVFFSTGVGFGYYTTYASYNRKFANAVQDAIIIVSANVTVETLMAFGVFGIIGFLGLHPDTSVISGSYDIGFVTFPTALETLPGSGFWSAIWFLTLLMLGVSSAFAMLDAVITLLLDANPRFQRIWVVTGLVVTCYLISLPFCTEFGYHLLNAVDAWVNNLALVFVVWAEAVASTTVYRWKDVASQVGTPTYIVYNAGYFSGMVFGVVLGHTVHPAAGAGLGFGLFIAGLIIALIIGRTPEHTAPRVFGRNIWLSKAYYLAFYQANQLRQDLNIIVGTGKNWSIPIFWGPLLRYVSAPILAIIFSFSYPDFYASRNDPLHILGFIISHAALIMVGLGFILPRWFDPIVPKHRREEGDAVTATGVSSCVVEAQRDDAVERAPGSDSDIGTQGEKKKQKTGGFGSGKGSVELNEDVSQKRSGGSSEQA